MGTVTIPTIQGDYGMNFSFTLQDTNGNVVSLAGVTSMYFRTQKVGNYAINSIGLMSVDNAAQGTCHYTVQATDFIVAGLYNAQVQVNYSGETLTWNNLQVDVLPKVPF